MTQKGEGEGELQREGRVNRINIFSEPNFVWNVIN